MRFNFEATGVGSVPFTDPKTACRVIFDNFDKIPFWPQLIRRSYLENMYTQFSERLPGLILDNGSKTIHIDTKNVSKEIEEVYARYLDGDVDFFKISEEYAGGLYEFLNILKSAERHTKFVKGQTTGPISFALSLTDENKRAVIYDKDLFEVLAKVLAMRVKWQIRRIRKIFPGGIIIFIDEPYLVSLGSSYVNIDVAEASKKLDELIAAIKGEGALAAIHCCGNTDWSFLLRRDIDILNFDAYTFTKEFFLYADDIKNFLQKSGTIAWGIVPSSDAVDKETAKSLLGKMEDAIKALAGKGIEKGSISSMITPSCGVGTLDEDRAKKILEMTRALSAKLSKK